MYGKILIRCDLEVRTGMHIGGSSASVSYTHLTLPTN